MKANEAPEKIYLDIEPNLDDCTWHLTNPNGYSIEYARTDAFIEKACSFLFNTIYDKINSNSIREELMEDSYASNVIEDFRKYMEE